MKKDAKIFVAGHKGLVGSAIVRKLVADGYSNIVTRTRTQLDLIQQAKVEEFFKTEKPEYVFLAAAKVGGIVANNTYPADFIMENLIVQVNVMHNAYAHKVKKLLFLGSSCIYPRHSTQPIKEEYLLTGPLEPTNEPYALAKIAGLKMCEAYNRQYGTDFISVMPTNLYGPNDNFDLENSHVLPALLRKFHEAKVSGSDSVVIWGTGSPRREFLHVDDLAEAVVFLMNKYASSDIINIGVGEDISIKELAHLMKDIVGFEGKIEFDKTRPDGMPRKLLDVSKINGLGWKAKTDLKDGLKETYAWYLRNDVSGKAQ
jgi:GDP-L-fucose synthase